MVGALTLLAQDGRWGHMDGWDTGWMWVWGTLMMLTWVAILAGVAWVLIRHGREAQTTSGRAREVLDERLASGEISPEEYRERRDLLG